MSARYPADRTHQQPHSRHGEYSPNRAQSADIAHLSEAPVIAHIWWSRTGELAREHPGEPSPWGNVDRLGRCGDTLLPFENFVGHVFHELG